MSLNRPLVAIVVACAAWSPSLALAQDQPSSNQAPSRSGAAAQQKAGEQLLKQEQLEQLVSPIALYPDDLLAQVLMAATYPLEVVEASRWVTAHKTLKGTALKEAIDKEKWDDSIKGLIATPQVLDMMSNKLSWTKDLGDAVLAQQADVMDAVQKLRARADANKKLTTTKEQKVTKKTENNKQVIVIESAVPNTVYVPYYDPNVVYGAWPYPAYPPYYYPPPYGYYPAMGAGIAFATGVALGAWAGRYWGSGCGWGSGSININNNFNRVTHWNHNPAHRQGVRYNNANVANRYGRGDAARGNAQNRADFRGRDGNRPGGGDRPGAGNRPGGGDRPGAGNRPGGGDRPGAGNRPGSGNRPSAGNRPSTRPSGGNRPSAGGRPGGSNAFSGAGGSGRNTVSQSARGHASMGGRGGGGFHGGGGGGFRGGGGGGGRGGGGGGRRSDIHLKHDITLLGHLDNGLGFYRFSYNGSERAYVGVIAQEVQAIAPAAVTTGWDGYLRVHYEKLGVKFQTYRQWVGSGAVVPSGAKLH
jgi:hypothetical protein